MTEASMQNECCSLGFEGEKKFNGLSKCIVEQGDI
jgi:hypothetical protein